MDARRAVAIGLALASLGLAVTFGVMMAACGAMEQGSSWDAATNRTVSYGPRCVPVFYPLAPVWAVAAVGGAAGLWRGLAWPAIALGAAGTALGVVAGFSAGFFGIGCGALLLAAGLVGRRRAPPPAPSEEVR